jgi:beta-alanine--pyruvate transaminase
MRTTADTIAMSPPLIIQKSEIDLLIDTLRGILKTLQ